MPTTQTINKALEHYQFAINELMRPEEDVMLLSACMSVKTAFREFLTGFLRSKNLVAGENESIDSLMEKCIYEDPNFLKFNMEKFTCRCDSSQCTGQSYCMTMDKVKECLDLVGEVGSLVVMKTGK